LADIEREEELRDRGHERGADRGVDVLRGESTLNEDSHHPRYTPLAKVDDDAIKVWARDPGRSRARDERSYRRPEDDRTISTGKD